jgi:plastocyanin
MLSMRKALALLAMLLAASALVACGGDDDDDGGATTTEPSNGAATGGGGGGGGGETLQLAADPNGDLAFDTDQLDAKAGNVTIDFTNQAPIGHDVAVEDPAGEDVGKTPVITESEESLELSDLKPGDYTYYCSVPGHREGGMEGKLTVK